MYHCMYIIYVCVCMYICMYVAYVYIYGARCSSVVRAFADG